MQSIRLMIFFSLLLFFQSCIGSGDMFARRDHIVGNYYLMEDESFGFSVAYKSNNGFSGRNPPNTNVIAYALKDSVLVMKIQFPDSSISYLAIDMNRDSEFANEGIYTLDEIKQNQFLNSWIDKRQFKFVETKGG